MATEPTPRNWLTRQIGRAETDYELLPPWQKEPRAMTHPQTPAAPVLSVEQRLTSRSNAPVMHDDPHTVELLREAADEVESLRAQVEALTQDKMFLEHSVKARDTEVEALTRERDSESLHYRVAHQNCETVVAELHKTRQSLSAFTALRPRAKQIVSGSNPNVDSWEADVYKFIEDELLPALDLLSGSETP